MPTTLNMHFPQARVVVLQAAKCGSTSVGEALGVLLGAGNQTALRRSAIPRINALDAFDARNRGALVIAIPRNPFDRLVSCWKDKVIKRDHPNLLKHGIHHGMDFEEFVEAVYRTGDDANTDPHIRAQTFDWHFEGKPCWDHLFPLETLDDTWKRIRSLIKGHCGISVPNLKRLNTTEEVEADWGWTKTHVDWVVERYARDFEMLGYPTIPEEPEEEAAEGTEESDSEQRTGTDG